MGALLPHGPEMTLIDQLIESSAETSIAVVTIRADSEFAGADGVPAWVGIEYMAQTIAARIGFESYKNKESPPVGFLLGTRQYDCLIEAFPVGSRLRIRVAPLFVDAGFGSFTCEIETDSVVARSVINTYQPTREFLSNLQQGPQAQ
jgi:predicted hotdog family 3-hydroxylacyl-ACP dehydratase